MMVIERIYLATLEFMEQGKSGPASLGRQTLQLLAVIFSYSFTRDALSYSELSSHAPSTLTLTINSLPVAGAPSIFTIEQFGPSSCFLQLVFDKLEAIPLLIVKLEREQTGEILSWENT